jgi:hypothetical protein
LDKFKSWLAFLRNHRGGLVGMDFLAVPTASFRLLWIIVVLRYKRRRIMHFTVTDHPRALWVVQQLRGCGRRTAGRQARINQPQSSYFPSQKSHEEKIGQEDILCAL